MQTSVERMCPVCGNLIDRQGNTDPDICYDCETVQLYMDYISSLDILNVPSETVMWGVLKRSNTRQLMSRLRHSYGDAPADKSLEAIDALFIDNFTEEFVVIPNLPSRFVNLPKYGNTLSGLKQKGSLAFLKRGKTCKEGKVITLPGGVPFHIWDRPYLLRAQTVSDMDYGNRWEGRALVHEGNKFSDTSRFYIVGYLVTREI